MPRTWRAYSHALRPCSSWDEERAYLPFDFKPFFWSTWGQTDDLAAFLARLEATTGFSPVAQARGAQTFVRKMAIAPRRYAPSQWTNLRPCFEFRKVYHETKWSWLKCRTQHRFIVSETSYWRSSSYDGRALYSGELCADSNGIFADVCCWRLCRGTCRTTCPASSPTAWHDG